MGGICSAQYILLSYVFAPYCLGHNDIRRWLSGQTLGAAHTAGGELMREDDIVKKMLLVLSLSLLVVALWASYAFAVCPPPIGN